MSSFRLSCVLRVEKGEAEEKENREDTERVESGLRKRMTERSQMHTAEWTQVWPDCSLPGSLTLCLPLPSLCFCHCIFLRLSGFGCFSSGIQLN